jgi:hypothetical protein
MIVWVITWVTLKVTFYAAASNHFADRAVSFIEFDAEETAVIE